MTNAPRYRDGLPVPPPPGYGPKAMLEHEWDLLDDARDAAVECCRYLAALFDAAARGDHGGIGFAMSRLFGNATVPDNGPYWRACYGRARLMIESVSDPTVFAKPIPGSPLAWIWDGEELFASAHLAALVARSRILVSLEIGEGCLARADPQLEFEPPEPGDDRSFWHRPVTDVFDGEVLRLSVPQWF